MRIDTPSSPITAVARVRAELGRTRRRLANQSPALRWSLGLAAAAALVGLVYAVTVPATPLGVFVRSGEQFPSDDLISISHALDAKSLPYHVDGHNRVEVAAGRLDEANGVIAKLEVGTRPLSEIERKAAESSPWDTFWDREQRKEKAHDDKLGAMIGRMDGIVAAYVSVNRPRVRGGARHAPGATAFVYLETKDEREIPIATVESIQSLISGAEPDVKHDAVSVFDRKGRHYLDARNPLLGIEAKNRARQEELQEEITRNLDWVKGARVSVQLVAAAEPAPPVASVNSTHTDHIKLPPLSVGVNQPLELAPEEPAAAVKPEPALKPLAAADSATNSAGIEPINPPRARVWVKVPRSYYVNVLPRREPSLDDLQPLVERTRVLIETAVKHVVPPSQLDQVRVDTIPDDLAARDSITPAARADALRVPSWWVPVGAALGVAAVGLAVAFGVLASRRPPLRSAPGPRDDRGRYKIDEASDPGPGPSERVRELIRLNPEAAASVLRRWTGQGGTIG